MAQVKTGQEGLNTREAEKRLIEHGENILTGKKKIGALKIFLGQFKDLMVIILLISTVLSVLMGEVVEAIAIISIVILNAVLGFVQEYRTEKTLEALKSMSAPSATVIRDGQAVIIPASEIVPDDVVLLKTGDRAPADGVLIESMSMSVDEALLTGESLPMEKGDVTKETSQNGKHECVYMGTTIVKGRGKIIVTATGMETEMGKIAVMLDDIDEEPTPLQRRLDQLGKYIAIGCLGICAIVSITGILRGENIFDMVITGISLAVAAVPEGLPAIVTIALALAVSRILKRNALVKNLHAVETLGCASVICSDKTGTLTENKMTVREIATVDESINVTGTGYSKIGELIQNNNTYKMAENSSLSILCEIAWNCNNAELRDEYTSGFKGKNKWTAIGESTEIALLIMCEKANAFTYNKNLIKIKENPFDSTRKCMSVVVRKDSGQSLYVKGAPDVLLDKCMYYITNGTVVPITSQIKEDIKNQNNKMAGSALRVLGFAYKKCSITDREDNLIFVGLVGMIDPPRREAYDAVAKCKRAKIRPVMITGDHKLTACAIAKDLGILGQEGLVMTGAELDKTSEETLDKMILRVAVFARVTPAHKLRIVRALKKKGEIVAMTGDGVNDAPAIKEANIGVAMGINGTDVTKEAASIILLDDNFATLVQAVEEGRVIYSNIRKFIRYLLSCNIGEVVTMFVGMLMGMPIILLPIQILLVNLVTDGLPAMALGMEGADGDIMNERPRRSEESIFSNGLFGTILFRGILIGLTTLSIFVLFYRLYGGIEIARTGALLTLITAQLFHVFECKSEKRSLFGINIFSNLKLILAVIISGGIALLAVYNPVMRAIFATVELNLEQIIMILLASMVAPIIWAVNLWLIKRKPMENQVKLRTLRLK